MSLIDLLDASSAINFVTEKVVRLHKKKSEFKDIWLTWRYKTGFSQETSAQIKVVEKSIEAVSKSYIVIIFVFNFAAIVFFVLV